MNGTNRAMPTWLKGLIILLLVPAVGLPGLLASCPQGVESARWLVWCYPFYLFFSGWLAWKAYAERPLVSWILLIMMALSSLAIYSLTIEI